MVYLSLYRRQRPLTFSGMTGQEHVARTLSHALARGQLAHAYLSAGRAAQEKLPQPRLWPGR